MGDHITWGVIYDDSPDKAWYYPEREAFITGNNLTIRLDAKMVDELEIVKTGNPSPIK